MKTLVRCAGCSAQDAGCSAQDYVTSSDEIHAGTTASAAPRLFFGSPAPTGMTARISDFIGSVLVRTGPGTLRTRPAAAAIRDVAKEME